MVKCKTFNSRWKADATIACFVWANCCQTDCYRICSPRNLTRAPSVCYFKPVACIVIVFASTSKINIILKILVGFHQVLWHGIPRLGQVSVRKLQHAMNIWKVIIVLQSSIICYRCPGRRAEFANQGLLCDMSCGANTHLRVTYYIFYPRKAYADEVYSHSPTAWFPILVFDIWNPDLSLWRACTGSKFTWPVQVTFSSAASTCFMLSTLSLTMPTLASKRSSTCRILTTRTLKILNQCLETLICMYIFYNCSTLIWRI